MIKFFPNKYIFQEELMMNRNFKKYNTTQYSIEDLIKLRAYYLWQESSEYHEAEYYWHKAKNQIEIEKSLDIYQWYSPPILERLTIFSALIGLILYFLEAEQRREQFVLENWRGIAEASEMTQVLQKPAALSTSEIIRNNLERLNQESPSIAQVINITGGWQSFNNMLARKKQYYSNKKNQCEKKLEIPFFPPRWPRENLSELGLPEGVKLDGVVLCNADLGQAVLKNVKFNLAKLAGANLFEAELNNTELVGSDLRESSLVSADLTGANLTGADLTKADLTGANLTGANLTGAKLDEIENNNLTRSQIKLACNWDQAFYIYEQVSNTWKLNETINQLYIEQIKQDKTSDPQEPANCSKWN